MLRSPSLHLLQPGNTPQPQALDPELRGRAGASAPNNSECCRNRATEECKEHRHFDHPGGFIQVKGKVEGTVHRCEAVAAWLGAGINVSSQLDDFCTCRFTPVQLLLHGVDLTSRESHLGNVHNRSTCSCENRAVRWLYIDREGILHPLYLYSNTILNISRYFR